MDILRDDSRIYARALRDAGVSVKTEWYVLPSASVTTWTDLCPRYADFDCDAPLFLSYPGLPHGFYESYPTISMAKKLDCDTREGLKWLLAGAPC